MSTTSTPPPVTLRPPAPTDAAPLWRLLAEIDGLERNTCYAYVLLCSHFADTGLIAEVDGRIAGFVLGYRHPTEPDVLFVWQVGVAPAHRGQRLGARMLDALLARPWCRSARRLCATVGPDNTASRALFTGLARRRGAPCTVTPGFTADLFADPHAAEELLTIGPFPRTLERSA